MSTKNDFYGHLVGAKSGRVVKRHIFAHRTKQKLDKKNLFHFQIFPYIFTYIFYVFKFRISNYSIKVDDLDNFGRKFKPHDYLTTSTTRRNKWENKPNITLQNLTA